MPTRAPLRDWSWSLYGQDDRLTADGFARTMVQKASKTVLKAVATSACACCNAFGHGFACDPVPYTHLTLPTLLRVLCTGGAASLDNRT